MARRYDHSREELNEMAMQAATKIVAEEGLRALSTRRVAKKIGYSVGTIYNLFSNLDDLVLRLNGATLDNLHQALSALGRTGMPEEDLRALAAKYISFTQDNFHLWNSLFEHRLPAGEELPDNFSRKVNSLLALVEEALEPVFGENEQECQKSARVLWSSLHGICSLVTSDKLDVVARETAHELTDSLITHYLAGLKKGE